MECTNCHQQVPDSAKVCGYCGHRLKTLEPVPAPVARPPEPRPTQGPLPAPQVQPPPAPRPVAKPKKRNIPGWVWGIIIGGILLVIAICVAVIFVPTLLPALFPAINPPTVYEQPAQNNEPYTDNSPPDAAPPEVPPEVPPEEQPASQPEVVEVPDSGTGIPAPVFTVIREPSVVWTDEFDTLYDWYTSEDTVGLDFGAGEPFVYLDGSSGYNTYLIGAFEIWFNQAVLIKFATAENADAEIFLSYGDWQTSDYRRVGMGISENRILTNFWYGNNPINAGDDVTGSLSYYEDHWYYALIATSEADEAGVLVWDAEDETNMSNLFSFGGDINDLIWTLTFQIGRGWLLVDSVTLLDSYGLE